jgi:hypothetical protein
MSVLPRFTAVISDEPVQILPTTTLNMLEPLEIRSLEPLRYLLSAARDIDKMRMCVSDGIKLVYRYACVLDCQPKTLTLIQEHPSN